MSQMRPTNRSPQYDSTTIHCRSLPSKVFNYVDLYTFPNSRNAQVTFVENPQSKIISDKAFQGTVVNRALQSLQGKSLENTLTVPLR